MQRSVAAPLQGFDDVDLAGTEVDIPPPKREQLSALKPRQGLHKDRRGPEIADQSDNLRHRVGASARPPLARGPYDGCGVIQNEPFTDSFAQNLFEQREMIVDRLLAEPPLFPAASRSVRQAPSCAPSDADRASQRRRPLITGGLRAGVAPQIL